MDYQQLNSGTYVFGWLQAIVIFIVKCLVEINLQWHNEGSWYSIQLNQLVADRSSSSAGTHLALSTVQLAHKTGKHKGGEFTSRRKPQ